MADAEHEFGGPWTEIKLDAISDYLGFYTAALKAQPNPSRPFELWYVDAFAGSGERTATIESGGLFEGTPVTRARVQLDGSV
jgi:three-Cys-motif partner protein